MAKYVCSVCGYVYDEAAGIPEDGIAPGTKFEDLPEDWVCPLCAADKSVFELEEETAAAPAPKQAAPAAAAMPEADEKEMSALELSALCTNLARGCEKQYKPEEAALFQQLSDYFKSAAAPAAEPNLEKLMALIEQDLSEGFPAANAAASAAADRGALRALVWSEKVTRILNSIISRYQKEGDAMLTHTGVYVCTICGFIYIGNALPEVCPVCKVPNWKFEKKEGR